LPFSKRIFLMSTIIPMNTNEVRRIMQIACNRSDIEGIAAAFMREKPTAEGMVIRDAPGKFEPGKRTWCYQKYVPRPTIDLRVHSAEEAISATGQPLGMVGRLNFWFNGRTIGVGPGKLTHAERTRLWQDVYLSGLTWDNGAGPMACIQYKADESYDDLREPTFQHWRTDKGTPDA
jgi:hypothetical protein